MKPIFKSLSLLILTSCGGSYVEQTACYEACSSEETEVLCNYLRVYRPCNETGQQPKGNHVRTR